MFLLFVAFTLYVTCGPPGHHPVPLSRMPAAKFPRPERYGDCRDFMSASFLGITGLMYAGGFDGLILSLVPLAPGRCLFLFARRVRTWAVLPYRCHIPRLDREPIRLVTVSTIVIVIMYLIQM